MKAECMVCGKIRKIYGVFVLADSVNYGSMTLLDDDKGFVAAKIEESCMCHRCLEKMKVVLTKWIERKKSLRTYTDPTEFTYIDDDIMDR